MTSFWMGYIVVSILLGICAIIVRENLILLSALIAAIIAMKIAFIYAINNSAKLVYKNLASIVSGQLNINIKKSRVKAINRIGEKFNEYLDKIRHLAGQFVNMSDKISKESETMKNQAGNLRITASEIASTVQNISEAVNNQAYSTVKVKENIDIFSQGVENIYANAIESLNAAKNSKAVVDESFYTFKEAFEKIEEVKQYNDVVLQNMIKLNNSVRQIHTITETVESIASQTHLLSLNASIEAARAGEAGRGFAVVAGEVSKLADDSSNSAKKIKELIEGIIKEIDSLTNNLKTETKVIENNVAYAEIAFKKSEDINAAVMKNMDAAQAIVDVTEEQKAKLKEIAMAIENINEATQQNAAVVEEITASTQEQLSIVETMYESIVNLSEAIEKSEKVIGDFMKGFRITDEIKNKIETVKTMMTDILKTPGLMNRDDMDKLLKEKQESIDFVELIVVVDEKGVIKYASREIPDDQRDCSARVFFQRAIKGETFVSKEYISILTNNYNITVSMPIYEEGIIKGALIVDINLNEN